MEKLDYKTNYKRVLSLLSILVFLFIYYFNVSLKEYDYLDIFIVALFGILTGVLIIEFIRIGVNKKRLVKKAKVKNTVHKLLRYDLLTKLPNRKTLLDKIDKHIKSDKPFALVFIDLNRFKKINDGLGYKTGDKILRKIAHSLQSKTSKDVFIARLGGDEFVALLENKKDEDEINLIVKQLFDAIEQEFVVNDYKLYVGASMGIALYPSDAKTKRELLSCADKAMIKAKDVTLDNSVYFKNIDVESIDENFVLEDELRTAIRNGDFKVFLQPQVDSKSKKIKSFEALIRWNKDGKIVSPFVFISLAEEIGLISFITKWMIKEVFKLSKKWHNNGHDYKIAINLSAIDFMSDEMIEYLIKCIKKYDVEPSWIELELTEGVLIEDNEQVSKRIERLIQMGFFIALDDFGTGYSSLAYINKFSLDTLKIDKMFIDHLEDDNFKNLQLLKAIITIAKDLKLELVAEGVSSQKQAVILEDLGCELLQGFLYYKPMCVEDVEELISSH